ncbi:MAG: site-specific integrase [Gammaproteobacteria bacterium]|nr:site-specific integrase [Gammaproteobacteria bacterium]
MNQETVVQILNEVCTSQSIKKFTQSKNTFIAYKKGWNSFTNWCYEHGLDPFATTPQDIVKFLITKACITNKDGDKPLSLNTVRLYRSAINDKYREAEKSSPAAHVLVNGVLRGLAKSIGDIPRRVKAIKESQLIAMLKSCSSSLYGTRDAAVLAVGFAAALRRSEMSSLQIQDLEFKGSEGVVLLVRQSKTDLRGIGQRIAIPKGRRIRPIHYLQKWLSCSAIESGFVFQTLKKGGRPTGNPLDPGDVARVVKRYVKIIGLDPRDYSGHSLRSGFVTAAATHHARIEKIMEVTRHRNFDTLMKYIRNEEMFIGHAGSKFL